MPIIINELVVKATIADAGADAKAPPSDGAIAIDRRQLVDECVEEVMRILQREKER